MTLRIPRERLFQTVAFETGGLIMIAPLYALFMGQGSGETLVLFATLSAAVMVWSPLYNTLFDWADLRLSGRLASERPHRWRIVHALLHEVTTVVVTLPLLIWLGGHSWQAALALDLALTLFYAAYAYLFHLAYDHLRPVTLRHPLVAGSAS